MDGIPDVVDVPVVVDLHCVHCVADHVQSYQYSAVCEQTNSAWPVRRPHQLVWDLKGAGLELTVKLLNLTASGVG
jgi:hypothetical protein